MRLLPLMLLLVSIAGASTVRAEPLAAAGITFAAMVASQARVNVDAQGSVLSVYNTADGSGNRPAILNVYCGDVNIPMTPAIQANLETISPLLDWGQGGLIYPRQVAPSPTPTLPHPRSPILPNSPSG